MQPIAPGQHIPQAALDHYNAHFNKLTYNAFRDKLQAVAADNPAYGEAFIKTVLDLILYGIRTDVKCAVREQPVLASFVSSGGRFS